MRCVVFASVIVTFAAGSAFAQEGPGQKALTAWKKYQKVSADYSKVASKALAAYRKAVAEKKNQAAAVKKYLATVAKPRAKLSKALEQFGAAFAKSDWNAWDPKKHAAALQLGLTQTARSATKAGDLALALKAHKTLVKRMPKSRAVNGSTLAIGDLLIAQGDLMAARKQYKIVAENGDSRSKTYAEQRLHLVGKTAPNIDSNQWIGAEPTSLAKLKGKVVVVDFWATWCGPCRVVMPALSKLYATHKKDGLVVMGVTRFYKNGYLPANPKQMLQGGKSVRGISEDDFRDHVKTFRDNTKMSYPFVIGEKSNFQDYKVRGIPTVAVVGVDGNVALLAVGSGSEPLVRAVVERELKKVK